MNENITGRAAKENVALPLSNENVQKKRNNLLKSVVGVSVLATGLMMAPQNAYAQEIEQPAAIVAPQEETGANTNVAPTEQASDNPVLDEKEEDKQGAVEAKTIQVDEALNEEAKNVEETAMETPAEEAVEAPAEEQAVEAAPAKARSAEAVTKEETAKEAGVEAAEATVASEEDARKAAKPTVTAAAQPVITSETGLEIGEEKTPEAQGEGETATEEDKNLQKADDPNYGDDEAKIQDYNSSNRYKETDLQPGDTNQSLVKTDEKVEKDGFKFEIKNPSETSPSKTEYGYEITIDKKTGQRTYTKIDVTDSGLIPVGTGDKSMMSQGDKLTPESPDVTYKPNEDTAIDKAGRQINLNYGAEEETLKHINNKDNDSTSLGMKDNYTQDNPSKKFFGDNFSITYKVNPWPNENDKLEQLKLNGKYDKKVFVQGQEIDTGIKVDNIDDNAKERLVGQVYNPITGKIVPGASAYIGKNGNIHIKMPEGALKKDDSGKTVINEDSIFNTPDYKALQNLDVKFFARPRTADEFKAIAEAPEEEWEKGTYVETGAGPAEINHKGKTVTIDKQGIDRYDHYNLIGSFKLNLDDTRYYDQSFEDEDGKGTEGRTYLDVKPGKDFTVKMSKPTNPSETDKSAEEMNEADKKGEASGRIIMDFINKENEGKAEKDKWKLEVDPHDISKFTVKPPKSAKAGDFIAVPIEYTYTNGSKDVHYFHFVVKESTYIKPEYDAQVNFPVNEQTSEATVAQDTKRISPDHYTLPDTLKTDEAGNKLATDDKGNKWTVKVDEKTGKVTAKPVDPTAFDGGEKLTVPVIAHYVDEQKPGKDITEEANAYFVIEEKANMTARYNAKAGKSGDKLSSDVILNTEDKYNRRPGKYTLDSPTYTDDKGNTWNVSIDEESGKVTATVPNAEEGKSVDGALLNVPVTAHYYEEENGEKFEVGTKKTEVQFVAYGTNGKVEKTEEIPFETKVEKDPNLKKGEIKVITEGKKGSKKVTYTIEDSKIVKEEEQELEAPQVREIHVGEGVNDGTHKIEEKVEVPFETEIEFDDSLAPGEKKVTQEGEAGEKKRDVNLTIEDGNVTKTETGEFTETKAPKKRIIKVGRNTEGKVEHKEELPFKYKVEEVDTLKKGEYKIVKPGKVGTKTTTWTIKNSKVEGEPTVTEDPAEDALIQVGKGTNDGTHEVTEKKNIDYKTIIEYDEKLDAGQQEVIKEGNPGEQERTNTLVIKDGQVTETKEGEFKTTKEATNRVVKIGTKPVTKVVEKPFNTEYVYDENLESGKTEEVTPGKNGKVTITTTYDKDQKKVVTSETEEAGQNRVVKIGGKTNGTEKVKEEIPFEVEVRKDPSLKKGEWKYAKDDEGNELKGEKGEQEKTLTIVNSKVTETSEPTVTKKAKKAVVLVGEGTNDGTHEVKEKKALPFETKIVYDENLEAGQREETGGEPGEQERTNTLVIKDGKVEETKEGEFKTTKKPVDKVIKIGIKPIVKEVEKPFETEYIYDENVEMGKEEEVTPGEKGKVTITTSYDKDQNKLVTKEETKDPVKRVVKVGIKPVVKEEPIPQNTKFKHNPELKAGEIKKITDGTPGKVTVTTTFNKETGKIETKVERTEPTDAEYEYGSKTEGKVKVESDIPFEVEIKEDPEMEAGKTETVQEGKLGKKETTITVENSKEVSREEKVITDPVKKIVKVGTKCKCENPGGNTPGGNTPGGNTPGGNTPGGNTPGGNTPGGNTPGGNTPGGNTPGGNTPGGNTPGGNTPGGNTPGGNTPGGNTPGSEKPSDPDKNDPRKPGTTDPSDPGKNDPNKPGTTDPSDSGRINPSNTGKEGNDDEARRMAPAAQEGGRKADDDRKAPQTFDPGIAAPTGLGALASGLLIGLERLKRKNRK
ncbi:G5 domain protein [Aedoeadaptatus coxii]|uniref:G5 domain-containing protein n=1 Tax=Aedoeadaptatus coxii TaxID=755172 RepID=UPI00176B81F5|nr:G5 domain-containing protein [Peptoniphilus coxii]CAC9928622.1 G5 domain protein [Peptoniphilus coxii]